LFVDQVPGGAVVLDCRPATQYHAWHYPGAELQVPDEVASRMKELSKERTYVLYCEYGVQTAHIVELMQRVGYEAYSFRGGATRLRDWAARQPASGEFGEMG
jgi:thiamine biosynthesis protein ThiI